MNRRSAPAGRFCLVPAAKRWQPTLWGDEPLFSLRKTLDSCRKYPLLFYRTFRNLGI
jgi:hypothetical protein